MKFSPLAPQSRHELTALQLRQILRPQIKPLIRIILPAPRCAGNGQA
jgi:hypothetical protein